MPRAYSPNLKTVARANAAASALGITGWHLTKGPDVFWRGENGLMIRRSLKELEHYADEQARAEQDFGPVILHGDV